MKYTETKLRTEQKWIEQKEKYFAEKFFPPMLAEDVIEAKFNALPKLDFEQGKGGYIHGELETGKTVLAAKLMLEERKRLWLNGIESKRGFLFRTTTELFLELKRSFSPDAEITEPEVTKKYQDTYFLVLDDFGVFGKPSEWLIMVLYSIINHRMQYQKPTLFTSNYFLEEIEDLIGDGRIPSRIKRMGKIIQKSRWDKGL